MKKLILIFPILLTVACSKPSEPELFEVLYRVTGESIYADVDSTIVVEVPIRFKAHGDIFVLSADLPWELSLKMKRGDKFYLEAHSDVVSWLRGEFYVGGRLRMSGESSEYFWSYEENKMVIQIEFGGSIR